MNTFEAYTLWVALKLHFTTNYNIIKYHYKVKSATPAALEKRRDKYHFSKLAKLRDPKGFIIHNLLEDSQRWIGNYFSADVESRYRERTKKLESLTYYVLEEIKEHIEPPFDQNILVVDGQHPKLMHMFLRRNVSLETLVVLNNLLDFLPYWQKNLVDDPIAEDINRTIVKYQPFMPEYDREKMKKAILGIYNND